MAQKLIENFFKDDDIAGIIPEYSQKLNGFEKVDDEGLYEELGNQIAKNNNGEVHEIFGQQYHDGTGNKQNNRFMI